MRRGCCVCTVRSVCIWSGSGPRHAPLTPPFISLSSFSVPRALFDRTLPSSRHSQPAYTRYFLDNVAGWILELDRGQGIPFEGNYSQWLEAKAKRLQTEDQAQASRDKAILKEYEYVTKQRQGQQKKGKARLRAYEELVNDANAFVRNSTLDSITIPVGPRLGDVVVNAKQLVKVQSPCLGFTAATSTAQE